jgi:acetyltransferase-like isoleucine patch superfamily enzyme/dTDP-4-dehydrorhamnose 3,5-epimerase-like enzyme
MKDYFVHEKGICESTNIGARTRIWAFAHVLPGARIGADCNVCDNVFVENDVVIGDRVTIKCGVQVWDGVRLEDDVFVGPNATFTNDPFPRSRKRPDQFASTIVRTGASIGANATILPGITVGSRAMVGAGAVVIKSVPPLAIVVGNPARIVGYVDADVAPLGQTSGDAPSSGSSGSTAVRGVTTRTLTVARDMRGSLSAVEFERQVPFAVKRTFFVFDVPSRETRGEHAHRACHQFLVCVRGSCAVVADDGDGRQEFVLNSPTLGLHLPPLIWGIQYKYSPDAVLAVFASEHYDPSDYIRNYDEFLQIARARRKEMMS